jgi:ABC-2 type transport system ATP-binding protein
MSPRGAGAARAVVAVLVAAAVTSCSSSSQHAAPKRATMTFTTAPPATTTTSPARCRVPHHSPIANVTKVDGIGSDWTLTSFDGTKIRFHWFPLPAASAQHRSPTVLMGPGWATPGDTMATMVSARDHVSVAALLSAGYNVLTWDPRGFGDSTGVSEVDASAYEGRDVEYLIDWVARQPQAELDAPGDPRLGMTGASYGGAIQFVVAALDCRVDAIAPIITWNSWVSALFSGATGKSASAQILLHNAGAHPVALPFVRALQAAVADGVPAASDLAWLASRGVGDAVAHVTVPTLLLQGTVDNLFPLDEGIANYQVLRRHGTTVAMRWYCGGHGDCLTPAGDLRVTSTVVNWVNRYVKRDSTRNPSAGFSFVDQRGALYTARTFPLRRDGAITATGTGVLRLRRSRGSEGMTPAKATTHVVNVPIGFPATRVVVGAPQLTLTYRGTAPVGTSPTRVFAQLVDDSTGLVVGNQVTPIPVTLDGASRTLTTPLEVIVFTGRRRASVSLQLLATTGAYAQPRLGGRVTFTSIAIRLPVVSLHPR